MCRDHWEVPVEASCNTKEFATGWPPWRDSLAWRKKQAVWLLKVHFTLCGLRAPQKAGRNHERMRLQVQEWYDVLRRLPVGQRKMGRKLRWKYWKGWLWLLYWSNMVCSKTQSVLDLDARPDPFPIDDQTTPCNTFWSWNLETKIH